MSRDLLSIVVGGMFLVGPLLVLSLMRTRPPIESVLIGSWVGTLEYRDYSDDSHVALGTLLRVSPSKANGRLTFRYVYDDGPSKVIQDSEEVEIDFGKKLYQSYASPTASAEASVIDKSSHLDEHGFGKLVLVSKGKENNLDVDLRETISIQSKQLKMLRETRLPGQRFRYRHEYTLSRVGRSRRKLNVRQDAERFAKQQSMRARTQRWVGMVETTTVRLPLDQVASASLSRSCTMA